ncbi:GNAT family N-acetyltransferase [Kiloniella sp. b19]|uniref:GNAT family N-acetyltransferase n=1 Tax=Kiloniella sp. GXU_MW_B19 TaxID=3141326 RepID=UPI0031E1E970
MNSINSVPVLETERLVLRGHQISDFEDVAALWADPQVVERISGRPSTAEESWSRLLRYTGHWIQLGYGYWVVTDKQNRSFLGEIGFANYRRQMSPPLGNTPEAGWALKSAAHGKGYATEAVQAILNWADTTLEHDRTVCIMSPSNTASLSVARKVGYGNPQEASYKGENILMFERLKP